MPRRLASAAWVGALAAVLVGLAPARAGVLAPPPVSPERWAAWAADRTALEAAAAVLRLVALGAAGYLLVVTVLGLAAALLRRRRGLSVVTRWSPPVVRWLLGTGLAGALAVGPVAADSASPPPTMVLLPDDDTPPRPTTTTTVVPPNPPPAAAPAVTTITLAPGDHLWSVAARTLASAWGRPPAGREVAPYWRLIVELNRPELPNPADPDLVFPGDVVRLPPVPG